MDGFLGRMVEWESLERRKRQEKMKDIKCVKESVFGV